MIYANFSSNILRIFFISIFIEESNVYVLHIFRQSIESATGELAG